MLSRRASIRLITVGLKTIHGHDIQSRQTSQYKYRYIQVWNSMPATSQHSVPSALQSLLNLIFTASVLCRCNY